MRIVAFLFAGVAMLLVASCTSSVYTPGYIAQVLIHQDATTEDYRWKNSISIPRPGSPRPLPRDDALAKPVTRLFESLLQGENLDRYMARTGTTALIAVKSGRIALERYGQGVKPEAAQPLFSVSKSVLSLLLNRSLEGGLLGGLDDPITKYLPELAARDANFGAITLAHLIDMRSGIAFTQDLSFPWITNDNPLVYHAANLRQVVLTQTRVEGAPGKFNYNDYNPNLIGLALERAAGAGKIEQLRRNLWASIGAEDAASWSVDAHGFPYWESGLVATPRDMAKIGLSLLEENTGEEMTVSNSWRTRIFEYPPSQPVAKFDGRTRSYRSGWWLILRPDGRHDAAAIGRFAQFIYVSPAYDVVIVRTGSNVNAPEDGDLAALFYAAAARLAP